MYNLVPKLLTSQSELNGEVGTVDSVDYSEYRYLVKMRDGHVKSVKGILVELHETQVIH